MTYAADRRTSVSKVIAEVVSQAMRPAETTPEQRISLDPVTGLKVLDVGRTVASGDVRRAMGDE